MSYCHVFGSKCFILNTKDNLGKFDVKSDEVIFLGYSSSEANVKNFHILANLMSLLFLATTSCFLQITKIKLKINLENNYDI
jgi:hypothetical protein